MSSSDSDQDIISEEREDHNDGERTAIREELSSLSFEELQKLKERIGAKVYKEALFGKDVKKKNSTPKVFKRENKNRPREMSSKKPVPMVLDVPKVKKQEVRDPRFDPLCGEFDKKQFSENYNFLSDMRMKDIKAIRAELKETSDPEKQRQLRRLLQRLNDQHKATKRKKIEDIAAVKDKNQVVQQFREGRQPHFKNKSELRVEALVKQYEDLKKEGTGRIQRHLKRRQQKLKKRSHKAPTGVS
ncbi:ribosomal RNA processing protein 36 homolog [Plodia interpunctella]|uniref:ribosomal RNA processing protein 36 homolog n=1 Tax=Plodia interpunctella TaxID=58824 RepID=UPI002367B68E|nr:ribosomal RNA processing protein 36 homolog [Plodia interpunctella]